MTRIELLEHNVRGLYDTHNPNRADWCDWLGDNHVFVVADYAGELARRYNANEELARAAAMLHDIADTKMSRFAEGHEEASLKMGRKLMQGVGFSEAEIALTIDDAVRYHSCHNGQVPKSLEGKCLSTGDSMAHLKTDFYLFATWAIGKEKPLPDVKNWVLKKFDRDFNNKILFDDIREECRGDYENLKELFSR